MKAQFTSAARFVEGNLDSVSDYRVAEMLRYTTEQYKAKKAELESMSEVAGVAAPTKEELEAEYNSFDLFDFSETPSTLFRDAVEGELIRLGYTYDKGVPGIEIIWNKNQNDVGPIDFVVNSASVTVAFSKESLDAFRAYQEQLGHEAVLSILS